MVYALLGHKSYVSSESFWYVFPRGFMDALRKSEEELERSTSYEGSDTSEDTSNSDGSEANVIMESLSDDEFLEDNGDRSVSVEKTIEDLADFAHSEDLSVLNSSLNDQRTTGGTRSYKVEGKFIFVTQVESYRYRGEHFRDYTPSEFVCIVDIAPRPVNETRHSGRGRKCRKHFPLDPNHPLYPHYVAVIRAKPLTPMFGGSPPPSCPRKK
jgi:hypothetical protein